MRDARTDTYADRIPVRAGGGHTPEQHRHDDGQDAELRDARRSADAWRRAHAEAVRTAADFEARAAQAEHDAHRDIARQIAMLAADPPLLRDWLTTCHPLPTSYVELLQALTDKLGRGDQPPLDSVSPGAQEGVTRLLVVVEWHGDYYGQEERVDMLREWIEGALTDRDDTPAVTITEATTARTTA